MQLGDLIIFTSKSLASIPQKYVHQNDTLRDIQCFGVDICQREKKIRPLEQRRKHL